MIVISFKGMVLWEIWTLYHLKSIEAHVRVVAYGLGAHAIKEYCILS